MPDPIKKEFWKSIRWNSRKWIKCRLLYSKGKYLKKVPVLDTGKRMVGRPGRDFRRASNKKTTCILVEIHNQPTLQKGRESHPCKKSANRIPQQWKKRGWKTKQLLEDAFNHYHSHTRNAAPTFRHDSALLQNAVDPFSSFNNVHTLSNNVNNSKTTTCQSTNLEASSHPPTMGFSCSRPQASLALACGDSVTMFLIVSNVDSSFQVPFHHSLSFWSKKIESLQIWNILNPRRRKSICSLWSTLYAHQRSVIIARTLTKFDTRLRRPKPTISCKIKFFVRPRDPGENRQQKFKTLIAQKVQQWPAPKLLWDILTICPTSRTNNLADPYGGSAQFGRRKWGTFFREKTRFPPISP